MKQGTSLMTRCLAFALALVLLVSNANVGLALKVFAGETDTLKIGEGVIVAENYELTDAEKNLISSGLLVGNDQEFSKPTDEDDLISVDNETKTVTVKDYEDPVSGKTWTPVEVKLVYEGDEKILTLNEGKAAYDYDGAAFSVEVQYQVVTEVDADVQAEMLRAAAFLKEGKAELDAIKRNSATLSSYGQFNEYLLQLADGSSMIKFQSQEAIDAAKALDAQIKANGSLELYTMARAYTAPYTKYLVENGSALEAKAVETYGYINSIMQDELIRALVNLETPLAQAFKAQDETAYNAIVALFIEPYDLWLYYMESVVAEGTWPNGQTASFLKEGIDYAELDTLVGKLGTISPTPTVKAELVAETADVQLNMSMSNVRVKVLWNTVGENNEISEFLSAASTITLPDGTEKADILAKIQETGFEAATVDAWKEQFAEFEHYEVSYSELPDVLGGDLDYVVTYNPVKYAVTGYEEASYPYGYTLTLPAHDDAAKEYDYYVNGDYAEQGSQVVILGNTEITRSEAAARDKTTLKENVLKDETLTTDEKNILNAEAFVAGNSEISIRKPDVKHVTLNAADGVVTAQKVLSDYPGATLYWIPVAVKVDSGDVTSTYAMTEGENGYAYTVTENNYDSVTVVYTLTVADQDAGELKNLPWTLVEDAKNQLESLGKVEAKMESLGSAQFDIMEMLKKRATGETLIQMENILEKCYTIDGKKLDLYHYLAAYAAKGSDAEKLVYYYDMKDILDEQMDILVTALKVILADEPFKEACAELSSEAAKAFEDLAEAEADLDKITLPPVSDAINVESDALMTLAEMLVSDPDVNYHASEDLVMEHTVTKAAPGKVTVTVNLVNDANKASFDMTVNAGQKLDAASFNTKYEAAFAKLNIDPADAKYYTDNSGAVADILDAVCTENKTYELTWTPEEYVVEVDGVVYGTITIKNKSITLPAHETEGMAYNYTVNGAAKNQGDLVNVWDSYHDETLTITREEFDQKAEEVKTKFEKFVAAVSGASTDAMEFTFNKDQTALTLKVDVAADQAVLMEALTGFVQVLVLEQDYSKIALNTEDNVLYQSLTFSIQALMNTVLSDANFNNAGLVNALENGEPLLTAKMILDSEKTIDFYVKKTGTAAEIEDAVNAIEAITPYVKFQGSNGELNVNITLPEKIYEVYLTALLGIGQVDLSDVNAVNTAIATMFVYDYMEDIIGDDKITMTTWQNTLNILDETAQGELPNYDLTLYEADYQLMRTVFNEYADVTAEAGIPVIALNVPAKKAIDAALDGMGAEIETALLEQIMEYGAEDGKLTAAINVTIDNTDTAFEAVVADLEAIKAGVSDLDTEFTDEELEELANGEGLANGIDYTSDLAERLSETEGDAFVLLLSDVNSDLVFNGTTVLDLNGKTVNGNIQSNGSLYIVNSVLGNAQGGVNGNISGNVTIIAGKYSQDVSAFVADGYKYENSLVVNELYTIIADGDDLTVQINSDVIDADIDSYETFAKALAGELALDVVMNSYIHAMLKMDSHVVYDFEYDDYMGLLAGVNKALNTASRRARVSNPDDAMDVVLEAIDLPGMADYINEVIADMLDFAAIEDALRGDGKFVTYTMTTAPWTLVIRRNAEYDCITGGLVANQEKVNTRTITLQFVGENKLLLADFFGFLVDDIKLKASVELVGVEKLTFSDNHFNVTGGVRGTLSADLSNYTTYLAILVANALDADAKTAMVNAVNAGDDEALKAAFDAITVKNVADALKILNAGDDFATLAENVGINADIDLTEKQQWLEAALMWTLSAAGCALEELEYTGTGDTLGALDPDGDGVYGFDEYYSKSGSITKYGYGVNYNVTAVSADVDVTLFKTESTNPYLMGDLNIDGKVDATDVDIAFSYVRYGKDEIEMDLHPDYVQYIVGDINGDDKIDATDVDYLYTWVKYGSESGWEPYPVEIPAQ